jgi:TadE-like protein
MGRSMSPSRGPGGKRGLRFESRRADKSRMHSPWKSERTASRRGREHERGQALVEFALIAPLFLLLVVGIIQFGIGLNYWLDLNRIANQGARWAVVDKYPNSSSQTLEAYLESEPVSGGLKPEALICYEPVGAQTGQPGEPLTVRVESDFTFLPILDLGTITLRGKATMRIEQDQAVLSQPAQGVRNARVGGVLPPPTSCNDPF